MTSLRKRKTRWSESESSARTLGPAIGKKFSTKFTHQIETYLEVQGLPSPMCFFAHTTTTTTTTTTAAALILEKEYGNTNYCRSDLTLDPVVGFPQSSSPGTSTFFRQLDRPPDRSSNWSKSRSPMQVASPAPHAVAPICKPSHPAPRPRRRTLAASSRRPHISRLGPKMPRPSKRNLGQRCTALLECKKHHPGCGGGEGTRMVVDLKIAATTHVFFHTINKDR